MEDSHYLSTAQVASALGVGVTTVKRWVDEKILTAHKTPGGHRKLLAADVLRLVKDGNFPNLDLGRLLSQKTAAREPADLATDLWCALKDGDETGTRALLVKAYCSGLSVVNLADQVIAPAMHQLGHAWETGKIDVWHEHRGTQMVAGALHEIKSLLEEQARPLCPVALGGAPEGDPYFLASLVIEMTLLELGWQAINLGPNTPLASLEKALNEFRPRFVWLSVSHLAERPRFVREFHHMFQEAERRGIAVALGGQGMDQELRASLPYTTFGDGMNHLAAFAKTLHPTPQRPTRGRPRGS